MAYEITRENRNKNIEENLKYNGSADEGTATKKSETKIGNKPHGLWVECE